MRWHLVALMSEVICRILRSPAMSKTLRCRLKNKCKRQNP
jgi:hypothetical protein